MSTFIPRQTLPEQSAVSCQNSDFDSFRMVAAGTSASPANAEWFAAFATPAPVAATPADELGRLFGGRGLALTLLAMFLTGLALNLTPCVYPMLSVTVSIFGGQRETGTVRVFFKALVYVLGMATMYSLLGMLAALTGGIFGGLMQNPWTLAAIGLLLAAMALSMFGLYELRPPAGLLNRLGGATTAGIVGVYFSGLLVNAMKPGPPTRYSICQGRIQSPPSSSN
jgi:thiol:disulfide interchange protein DsbD